MRNKVSSDTSRLFLRFIRPERGDLIIPKVMRSEIRLTIPKTEAAPTGVDRVSPAVLPPPGTHRGRSGGLHPWEVSFALSVVIWFGIYWLAKWVLG